MLLVIDTLINDSDLFAAKHLVMIHFTLLSVKLSAISSQVASERVFPLADLTLSTAGLLSLTSRLWLFISQLAHGDIFGPSTFTVKINLLVFKLWFYSWRLDGWAPPLFPLPFFRSARRSFGCRHKSKGSGRTTRGCGRSLRPLLQSSRSSPSGSSTPSTWTDPLLSFALLSHTFLHFYLLLLLFCFCFLTCTLRHQHRRSSRQQLWTKSQWRSQQLMELKQKVKKEEKCNLHPSMSWQWGAAEPTLSLHDRKRLQSPWH